MVKFHHRRKSGKSAEGCPFVLCEPKMNIHNPHPLWKTPVEKPVENVENSELSTGILPLSGFSPACGKGCITGCIFHPRSGKPLCYVTAATGAGGVKRMGKSLQNVKFSCQNLSALETVPKFFVKNRQNFFRVSFPSLWEYFYHPCIP